MCSRCFKIPHFDRAQKSRTVKWMSRVYVLVFLLHGVVCVGVSAWLETFGVRSCNFLDGYMAPVHVLLVAACLIVFICFAVVVYNCRYKHSGYFRSFSCILVIIVCFEISTAIVAGVMNNRLEQNMLFADMEKYIKESLDHVGSSASGKDGHYRKCWAKLQPKYGCCGLVNHQDWLNNDTIAGNVSTTTTSSPWHNNAFISSCGCTAEPGCGDVGGPYTIYQDGCHTKVKEKLSFIYLFIRIFGPVFGCMQAVAFLVLYCIFSKINKDSVIAAYQAKDAEVTFSNGACHI